MGFTEEELEDFKESFECFDKNKDGDSTGYIKAQGFKDLIRTLGFNPMEKELDEMLKSIGKDKITFDHVLDIIKQENKKPKDTVAEIVEVFKMFDKDGSGYISCDELRHILSSMGEKFTEEELDDTFKDLEGDGGMINYEDFTKSMLS